MLDFGIFYEIFATIRKNKLRTFLTGFSVAWGIFMLIVLLGAGNGLENGIREEFKGDAVNSIWIYSGQTSKAYKGMQPGRRIQFTNKDYDQTMLKTEGIEYASARLSIRSDQTIAYGNEYGNWEIVTVHPGTQYLEETTSVEGRFINEMDIQKRRKVVAISTIVRNNLFKKDSTKVLGEFIKVKNVPFQVVGVFTDAAERDMRRVYLPISTAQTVYNQANRINNLAFTTGDMTAEQSIKTTEMVREQFAKRHKFDIEDKRAIWIRNNVEQFSKFKSLFNGIALFVWVIGIFTLIAGVVGVSNIMIITVKERTKEIGVRKAIGATPGSIIGLVLLESLIIMAVAGYIGLVLGIGLLEFLSPKFADSGTFFKNPGVEINIAVYATVLLIVCGVIAGFFPALKAAKIKPIIALRDE